MKRNPLLLAAVFACGALLFLPRLAGSQEAPPPAQVTPAADFFARISSYHPSFIGWVFNDEPHATFKISIKYPFLPFKVFGADDTTDFIGYQSGLYIAYTGCTDIYFQRSSAPTISRGHNPGMFIDFNHCFGGPMNLAAGYFHDSNGQVVDTRAQYLAIPEHAQDFVSRGWDYLLLSTAYTFSWQDGPGRELPLPFTPYGILNQVVTANPGVDKTTLTFGGQGLFFLDKQGFGAAWKEESVFWEDVSVQPRRSDFDGIRISLILQNAYYRLAATVRTGYTAIRFSNNLSLTFRLANWLPLTIQYHAGYGPDLSSYNIYSKYMTVGCELYGNDQ